MCNYKLIIIILKLIYLFQEKEYFTNSNEFRLKIKGQNNVFLYNASFKGFTSITGKHLGSYYILGPNNYLISNRALTTNIYNNRCLYYQTTNNPKNYLIDRNTSFSTSLTNCLDNSPSNALVLYFNGSFIYYISLYNNKYYLSTDKTNKYYKFSSDISKALKLEKV
jgi:hypothetical protein